MSVDRKPLPVCVTTPATFEARRNTPGFDQLSLELQTAMISFSAYCLDFFNNPSDENRGRLQDKFAEVEKCGGRPVMALEVAIRSIGELISQAVEPEKQQ